MSNMQRYLQLLLLSLLITSVESAFFPAIGKADEATDYFEALRKPENKSPDKQAELRRKANAAKYNEVNKENAERMKREREAMKAGSKDRASSELEVGSAKPVAQETTPSKTGPTEVKLDDYREELKAPTPKK